MCCRSEWQERMYIYKWHEVDQTKHEIFCVHIVCNEIQVKVNLEITTFFFYLLFPYCPNFFWFGVVLQTLDGGLKWVLSKSGIYSKSYLLSYVAWCYSVHEWSHNTCFRSCSMNGHLHMIGTPRSSRTTLHWKWMTSGLVYGIVDSRLETQWKRQYDEDRFHFKTPE